MFLLLELLQEDTEEQMVDSLVPEVLPAPRSLASPKKTTEMVHILVEGLVYQLIVIHFPTWQI